MPNDFDLYPEERNKIVSTWAELQRKYADRPATDQTLSDLAYETQEKMRQIGFEVTVNIDNTEITDTYEIVRSPVINVVGRLNPEKEHDHDLHSYQVQHGEDDGVVGSLTRDGNLTDPKKIF